MRLLRKHSIGLTSTEFDYLDGVTSGIQTQMDGKSTASSTDSLTNKTFDANATGNSLSNVDLSADVTGTLPVGNGGTGATTLTSNYALLGNGTSAPQMIAPSTSGNVLTSNGSTWASAAAAGGGITGWDSDNTTGNNDLLPDSASAGIYLGVSSATAANLLDDYEYGTWTGALYDASSNAMTMHGSFQTGYYTKVGNLVTVNGYFRTTSLGSASGDIRITGLPFTTASGNTVRSGGGAAYATNLSLDTAADSVSCHVNYSQTHIDLAVWDATSGATAMQASEWSDDGQIVLNFSYRAA
jgi:hypothetical protein